jgi:hypothetical protein
MPDTTTEEALAGRRLFSSLSSDHRCDVRRTQGDLDLHARDNHVFPGVESGRVAVDEGAKFGNWSPPVPSRPFALLHRRWFT